jgi:ABC-type sugar transport system permease subunit
MSRTMLFVVVANTTANMLMFAPTKLITEGGPQNSTNVLMYEVYKSAYKNGNMSRAGAITTLLLVIILFTVIIQFRMLNRKDEV